MLGLSLVVASGGHSSSWCAGLSLSRPLLLRGTGSRRAGSVIVAHGPSCSAACGIFPDQGSNPCPLHWQADSQPLRQQGSPSFLFLKQSYSGTSLVVQWLSLRANNAGGPGSIPGQGTTIPHAATKSSHAATKNPVCRNKDPAHSNKDSECCS